MFLAFFEITLQAAGEGLRDCWPNKDCYLRPQTTATDGTNTLVSGEMHLHSFIRMC